MNFSISYWFFLFFYKFLTLQIPRKERIGGWKQAQREGHFTTNNSYGQFKYLSPTHLKQSRLKKPSQKEGHNNIIWHATYWILLSFIPLRVMDTAPLSSISYLCVVFVFYDFLLILKLGLLFLVQTTNQKFVLEKLTDVVFVFNRNPSSKDVTQILCQSNTLEWTDFVWVSPFKGNCNFGYYYYLVSVEPLGRFFFKINPTKTFIKYSCCLPPKRGRHWLESRFRVTSWNRHNFKVNQTNLIKYLKRKLIQLNIYIYTSIIFSLLSSPQSFTHKVNLHSNFRFFNYAILTTFQNRHFPLFYHNLNLE